MGPWADRDAGLGSALRASRRWGIDRAGAFLATLLVLLLVLPAAATAAKKPPPLPSCFETGSGYGLCQGEVIPGGGSVTKLIAPEDSKGDFVLTGPAPLQSTKPVACGDEGCVYNHLNWYIGSGAAAVKGCGVNESVCEVRVAQSLPIWSVVYVRQNNDDKILWAIWNSGHPAHKIKGTVDAHECGDTCKVVPLRGVSVTASGPSGSAGATTDAQGHYVITVPKGRGYKVAASYRGLEFKPASRKVDVLATVSGVNFSAEPECGLTLARDVARTASSCRLTITMVADPKKVKLEANQAGKLAPKYIKVRVRIQNPTAARIAHVQLLSLQPVPADRTQQLDQLAFPRGSLPVKFGDLEGGASKVKTLDLKVTGDGSYVINALALFDDPSRPGGNGRAVGQGGKFTVEAPLLYFTAETRNKFVQDGDSWYVTGHVRNLSSHQTLCVLPMFPKWEGNAGGLGPHEIGVVPVDDPAPPLAGPLVPGHTISFLMRAQTDAGGGTTSAVALKPRAVKGEPGDACNVLSTDKRPPLSADEVKLTKDSTHFQVRVDKYRSRLGGAGALEFFGGYAQGSYTALAHLYESGATLARNYGTPAKLFAALGHAGSTALSLLYHAAATSAWFEYFATPQERADFIQQCIDDFEAKTGKVWEGVQSSIQQSVGTWLEKVADAYFRGDTETMFRLLGQGSGETLTDTAIQMAEWEIGVGLLKKTGAVGRTLIRYGEERLGVLNNLTKVPVGRLLTFAEMQRLWGLAVEDYKAFRTIAEEEGVLIGVRGRSPVSVANLEEGAVWKHEELKPKNVNDIDVKYLGFDSGDKGLVALRTYSEKQQQELLAYIKRQRLSPAVEEAVLDRAKTRFGEAEFVPKIKQLSRQGKINVGFNYADNGLTVQNTSVIRDFSLETSQLKSGEFYYRPLQENPALNQIAARDGKLPKWCKPIDGRALCRVTGDMDGVYLTEPDGTALSPEKRIRVYNKLMAVGWQHPETLTWIKEGLFDFAKKTKILAGLELGGEAMMEFGPDGKVRATFLNLIHSALDNKVGVENYFVAVLGGYTSYLESLVKTVRHAVGRFTRAIPGRTASPAAPALSPG